MVNGHVICRDVDDLTDILEKKVVVIGNVRIGIRFGGVDGDPANKAASVNW